MRRLAWLSLLVALGAAGNDMIVDTRTLQMNDGAGITLTLEGAFAAIGEPHVPLQNLAFVGEPNVASEYAWVNGNVVRRKTFRYRVRPLAAGQAQVGPVVLDAGDGQRETLPAVALQVLADRVSGSNDAEFVLRELLATRRDPLFVVAEVEKQAAFVGEPIVVTWMLYNAATVQQWQIVSVPKLAEFWVEELARGENAERVYVGDHLVQRLPIRRSVLFPLRSGRLRVEGMTVEASVLRRSRRGPFAIFEGDLMETTFTSAPFDVDVKPLPPGPPVDAVGQFALRCDAPVQRNAGPVVLRVALEGIGNIRATPAPRFASPIAGTVQVEGGQVSVSRDEGSVSMTRRWELLIFPSSPGPLEVPALAMRTFDPTAGERKDLRCTSTFLDVVTARPPENASAPAAASRASRRSRWPLLGIAAVLVGLLLLVPQLLRELALRREVRAIVHGATPAEIRARMEERVKIDLREPNDRGDAWRALLSLLDAIERERDIAVNSERELLRRVGDVLRIARR